jgi:biofilm PGA synthesis N-glycosyltransferase PgaC
MRQTSDDKGSLYNSSASHQEPFSYEVLQQYDRNAVSNSLVSIFKRDRSFLSQDIASRVKKFVPVTVVIPAYNEESGIGITLSSLFKQSVLPERIIVVDDFSSDRTAEIAKHFNGVSVVRTPRNSGSKGHALNYGLQYVKSKYTLTMDADVTIADDGLQKMVDFMESQQDVSAACSFVLPNRVKTLWERSRFVEYLFSFPFWKGTQNLYRRILIASGCFTVFKTQDLKSVGGWPTSTIAEDMDLTWLFYQKGKKVAYNRDAMCFAIEPESLHLMVKQLKRWNTGFHQVLRLRWKNVMKMPVLREFLLGGLIDSFVGSGFYIFVLYLVISTGNPLRGLPFFALDVMLMCIPALWQAKQIKRRRELMKSIPHYLIVRLLNVFWFYYGFISVFIFKNTTIRFEKGH